MSFPAGPHNALIDVAGLNIGHAHDDRLKSGVTAIIAEQPATAAVCVLGGAPGTRETDLLEPHNTVEQVDAIVLSGGSAFGLDAASGVQSWLREQGRGFAVGPHRIPIVPSAILFDLINGGHKDWGRHPPYRDLGFEAAANAGADAACGSVGAGAGALVAGRKGGFGTASARVGPWIVAAGVAVNAMGSPTMGDSSHFWAAPFEQDAEFGGLGLPTSNVMPGLPVKFRERAATGISNTTIGVIATDAPLSKAQAKRLAISAQDGFARALWPAHTPFDGDTVFALATGRAEETPTIDAFIDLCAAASAVMARAIARGVFCATPAAGDLLPCWSQLQAAKA